MSNSASVTISDPRFHAGTTVKLTPRLPGSFYAPGQKSVGSARVRKDGTAVFDGLEEGANFWAVADDEFGTERAVAVTAKTEAPERKRRSAAAVRADLAQTRPVVDNRTRVAGARGTKSTFMRGEPAALEQVGRPTEGKLPLEVHPAVRQEDAKGPQRSDTITGSAEPTSKDEPQPGLRQDQVPKGTPQRSSTPHGEATVIPPGELGQPGTRQEDAPEGLIQRSATPHGEITPLPPEVQPKPAAKKKAKRGSSQAERQRTSKAKRATAPKSRRKNRTSTQQRAKRSSSRSSATKRTSAQRGRTRPSRAKKK